MLKTGLIVVLSFFSLTTCFPGTSTHSVTLSAPSLNAPNVVQVPVTKVIDGDTIKVAMNGKEETIRFLLIDTPETHHPKLGIQPFGPEASAETHRLLDHQKVTLELAKNKAKDHYGRYLAYIFVGNQSVEVDLLEKGLARVAYIIPPNTNYLETYRKAESIAKSAHQGVWQTPGYAQKDGFHPEVMKQSRAF